MTLPTPNNYRDVMDPAVVTVLTRLTEEMNTLDAHLAEHPVTGAQWMAGLDALRNLGYELTDTNPLLDDQVMWRYEHPNGAKVGVCSTGRIVGYAGDAIGPGRIRSQYEVHTTVEAMHITARQARDFLNGDNQ